MNNTEKFGLKIDNKLLNFIENEALPGNIRIIRTILAWFF